MQLPDQPPPGQPAYPGAAYPGYGAQPLPEQPSYGGAGPLYGYYAPAYGPPAALPRTSGFAIGSLVISILSWFIIPLIGGVVAVILGHIARSEIRKANGAIGGGGLALAGLIIGYIQVALMLFVIAIIIWFALIVASHPNTVF